MLDMNMISHLLKEHKTVVGHVLAKPITSLCISAITEGELLFALAKRPEAKRLHLAVRELLRRLDVLPWGSAIAARYGTMRAEMERQGRSIGSLDLRIAAHANGADAILVTSDHAFRHVPGLQIQDWTEQ
jgi:tRNA(fMet)-specific endonuclease VapC